MGATASEWQGYFPDLTPRQMERLDALPALYSEWNAKINLISRKETDFVERHLIHSLAITDRWSPEPGSTAVDIGTGGGFPGIPLAIAYPEVHFTLVDSTAKKIKAAQAIADEIGLTNVHAVHARAEKVDGRFDYALSRAVARLHKLVRYCIGFRMEVTNRLLCLKGGDLREEIAEVKRHPVEVYDLNKRFEGEFFDTKKLVIVDFAGRG